jgi:hypothetical protein
MHCSNTCDMYMCRPRHINDPVLSSLKMEGILYLRIFRKSVAGIEVSFKSGNNNGHLHEDHF